MQNTVYFGDRRIVLEEVKNKLDLELRMSRGYGVDHSSVFEIEKMQISVDDIRRTRSFCNKTSENLKLVFLSSFYWSDEVQNAMLKILEETPPNTYIYLFGYSEKSFLPTVLSRIQKVKNLNTNRYLQDAQEILSLYPNDRPDSKIVRKNLSLTVTDYSFKDDEEREKKDRESHILFLYALIDTLLKSSKLDVDFKQKLATITELADIEGGNPILFIDWLLLSSPKIA